eukprot:13675655-Alexandrium_andersonii.AAC.1
MCIRDSREVSYATRAAAAVARNLSKKEDVLHSRLAALRAAPWPGMRDLGAEPVGASHRLRNVFACKRCSKEIPVNDRLAHS